VDEVRVPGTNTGHGHVWCAADAELVAAGKAAEQQASDDMLAHYSAALDEIYLLRQALAVEAAAVERVLRRYTSLPKGVRTQLGSVLERLVLAARGQTSMAYRDYDADQRHDALRAVGASTTLTRSEWEERDRG